MPAPIEDYGLIGDATTVALISRHGSIDWLCLPRIDSDACFAKLLDNDQNGYWTLRPAMAVRSIVLRYATDTGVDGLPGHEATFLICSFWLADNYAMVGRLDEAEALLERLVSLTNDLGLLAEEYHPERSAKPPSARR